MPFRGTQSEREFTLLTITQLGGVRTYLIIYLAFSLSENNNRYDFWAPFKAKWLAPKKWVELDTFFCCFLLIG